MPFLKRRVAILAVLVISFAAGYWLISRVHSRMVFFDICDLVEERFYLNDQNLRNWVRSCHARARSLSFFTTRRALLRAIQDQMDLMQVSHFMIYTPAEDKKLWTGQARETGLRARWMDDHMMVYQILPHSPGEEAGFRLGDEILSINGRDVANPEAVLSIAGDYEIQRKRRRMHLRLHTAPIEVDSKPTLQRLDGKTALVVLSSFRAEYFQNDSWRDFVKQFSKYRRLIIDLRENAGGNFAAMLRALSTFMCEPKVIGRLEQPRKKMTATAALINDLSDSDQISEMDRNSTVLLETFPNYGCFRGPVIALVGPHTASVSEIFASALMGRPRTRVLGQPTAGDVILAIWYDLPSLGPGYSISIPEALFLTPDGKSLEGEGVYPQKEVFDDVATWRTGKDSWIKTALATSL